MFIVFLRVIDVVEVEVESSTLKIIFHSTIIIFGI